MIGVNLTQISMISWDRHSNKTMEGFRFNEQSYHFVSISKYRQSGKHRRNNKGPHYCPFMKGIPRWPVDILHKESITWKSCPWHVVITGETLKSPKTPITGCLDLVDKLTRWGPVAHICINKLTIIGSDNGLSPGRRKAIIWTNAGILLIGPLGTNFSEILIEI